MSEPPPMPLMALPVVDPTVESNADLTCPLCGYALRGLTSRRCPECGHAFDPDELRRERDGLTRWRFEEAPRRLIRAFAWTALATFRPFRFWADLRAADTIVPRRLALWAIAWLAIAAVAVGAAFAFAVLADYARIQEMARIAGVRGRFRGTGLDISLAGAIERTLLWIGLRHHLWMLFAILVWPLMAVLASQAFGVTLRRARIHRGHLWRCVLYAWPMTTLPCVALLVIRCFIYDNGSPIDGFAESLPKIGWQLAIIWGMSPISLLATALAALLSTLHLIAAHVRYLRLPQAAAQAVLVQALAWLFIASIVHAFSML